MAVCICCGSLSVSICGRCNLVHYCSKECQADHWKSGHKLVCKEYAKTPKKISEHDCAFCGAQQSSLNACAQCMLAYYCNAVCQTAHWKEGHKLACVPPDKRRPDPSVPRTSGNDCSICLELISSAPRSTLPCSHVFHVQCIEDVRKSKGSKICPLCRVDLPSKEEQMCWDMLKLDPTRVEVHCSLGSILEQKGDRTGAEAEFRAALKYIQPKHPLHAQIHSDLGLLLKDMGNLTAAKAEYEMALKLDPKHLMALNNFGCLLVQLSDFSGAETLFRTALKINPNYFLPCFGLAHLLMHHKYDLNGAEKLFKAAARIDPKHVNTRLNLVIIFAKKNDLIGVERECKTILKLDPTNTHARDGLAEVLKEMRLREKK